MQKSTFGNPHSTRFRFASTPAGNARYPARQHTGMGDAVTAPLARRKPPQSPRLAGEPRRAGTSLRPGQGGREGGHRSPLLPLPRVPSLSSQSTQRVQEGEGFSGDGERHLPGWEGAGIAPRRWPGSQAGLPLSLSAPASAGARDPSPRGWKRGVLRPRGALVPPGKARQQTVPSLCCSSKQKLN